MNFSDKTEARKWAKKTLASLDPSRLASASEAATVHLEATPAFAHADVVLAYLPMKAEADARFLIEAARARGKIVCIPRIVSDTEIEFARVDGVDLDGLPKDRYFIGIPPDEAKVMSKEELADMRVLCAVPGLLFDRTRRRLGRGKGYYDRFLSDMKRRVPPNAGDASLMAGNRTGIARFFMTVGFAVSEQLASEIPMEEFDVPMDMVATDLGIIWGFRA